MGREMGKAEAQPPLPTRRGPGAAAGRRAIHRLSARLLAAPGLLPGDYPDGGNLWLQVSKQGTRSWLFKFTLRGRTREMGLGPLHTVSLAEARAKALACRKLLIDGIDPIEHRKQTLRVADMNAAKTVTFAVEAEAYIEAHRHGWKNAKHADQWTSTLATYAFPHIGKLLVSEIDTALVMKCLQPIWTQIPETAARVRGRIESVIDYATALKHRTGDNPARWKGHLQNLLPAKSKLAKAGHHEAWPYPRMGEFMKALRAQEGTSPAAVEFIILTAARTGEAFNARWSEVDLKAKLWMTPAERMKSGRAHEVPLSAAAVKVLRRMKDLAGDEADAYIFPGAKEGKPLSNMAGLELLRRMGHPTLTVHGFRSSFRDWAAEQTNFPREVAEAALAHVLKDKTEAAYRRSTLLEKRRALMEAWAAYSSRETVANHCEGLAYQSPHREG